MRLNSPSISQCMTIHLIRIAPAACGLSRLASACRPFHELFGISASLWMYAKCVLSVRVFIRLLRACAKVLEGHSDEIFSCAFNYEGDTVITGSKDTTFEWPLFVAVKVSAGRTTLAGSGKTTFSLRPTRMISGLEHDSTT